MTNIQAIILGIIEGLTEFLPVSSTAHLALVSKFFGITQTDSLVVFEIAIQLGAIMAVVVLYWKKFFDFNLLFKLFIAFLPSGILGLLLFKYIKTLLSSEYVIPATLLIGGIILIFTEKKKPEPTENNLSEISILQAFYLGLAQSVAIIPGVSRSGGMIVAGLWMKIERKLLVEFTFLLAVPTMFAATLYSVYKNKEILSTADTQNILIGFVVSFVVALLVIKYFLEFIRKYDFVPFGIYRILAGLILFSALFI